MSPSIYQDYDSKSPTFHLLNKATVIPEVIDNYWVETVEATVEKSGRYISIMILLRRNFFSEFSRSSLPTMMLALLICATNMFYLENFDAAVGVNVTCLLAMTGFYVALGTQLPTTSGMKVIDGMQIKWIFTATVATVLQCVVVTLNKRCVAPTSGLFKGAEAGQSKVHSLSKAVWVVSFMGAMFDVCYIIIGFLDTLDVISVNDSLAVLSGLKKYD